MYIALFNVAGPGRRGIDNMYHKLDEHRAEMDRRYARRMGILYSKYQRGCWWWEVFDISRKLLLTSVLVFIEAGSVLQIWVGIFISLLALVMTVQFRPFVNWKLDMLNFTSQLCTLLTLICSLGFHRDGAESGLAKKSRSLNPNCKQLWLCGPHSEVFVRAKTSPILRTAANQILATILGLREPLLLAVGVIMQIRHLLANALPAQLHRLCPCLLPNALQLDGSMLFK
ncbi:hypothetical protein AB1Y20_002063 [Prymnesium parvum]|uniref:TRP C-terminal domain-containing protein n=1 Tax=Prymnesium parvum TaxID=97485 RepID=A0AB34J7G0_PRYPA